MPSRNLVQHHGKRGDHAPNGGQLYAGIPMELARDGKLSYLARSVAMFVWSHEEQWQQSAAAVAEALGMNRATVGKALAELQERGWMAREIHQIVGPSGKPRTAWERWHLQMTNRRFTPDEVRELSETPDVLTASARSDQTCLPHKHGGAYHVSTGGAYQTSTIGMESGMHLEVHSSNAGTDQDETGHESRSLAVAGTEATADGRGLVGPSQNRPAHGQAAGKPASAGATEAPEEYRPDGLHRATAPRPSLPDPFSAEAEADRRAKAEVIEAREERAARLLEPAPHRIADPWSS